MSAAPDMTSRRVTRDGRACCQGLARMLDEAAWDGQSYTRVRRLRVLRHLDNCKTCDDCTTCNAQKKKLIRPYVPVLIPFLIGAALRDRIYEFIRSISTPRPSADGDQDGPERPSPPLRPLPGLAPPQAPRLMPGWTTTCLRTSHQAAPGTRPPTAGGSVSGPAKGRKVRSSAEPRQQHPELLCVSRLIRHHQYHTKPARYQLVQGNVAGIEQNPRRI